MAERKYDLDFGADEALDNVIDDIRAAHRLGKPFEVRTVETREFRGGGNVNKAKITRYHVTIGKLDKQD